MLVGSDLTRDMLTDSDEQWAWVAYDSDWGARKKRNAVIVNYVDIHGNFVDDNGMGWKHAVPVREVKLPSNRRLFVEIVGSDLAIVKRLSHSDSVKHLLDKEYTVPTLPKQLSGSDLTRYLLDRGHTVPVLPSTLSDNDARHYQVVNKSTCEYQDVVVGTTHDGQFVMVTGRIWKHAVPLNHNTREELTWGDING